MVTVMKSLFFCAAESSGYPVFARFELLFTLTPIGTTYWSESEKQMHLFCLANLRIDKCTIQGVSDTKSGIVWLNQYLYLSARQINRFPWDSDTVLFFHLLSSLSILKCYQMTSSVKVKCEARILDIAKYIGLYLFMMSWSIPILAVSPNSAYILFSFTCLIGEFDLMSACQTTKYTAVHCSADYLALTSGVFVTVVFKSFVLAPVHGKA